MKSWGDKHLGKAKKIITFLGTKRYDETTYNYIDKITGKNITITTRFIQEAIHKIVGDDSVIYVGLTELARKTNWIDNGQDKGLKSIFKSKGIQYRELFLLDGRNEEEVWKNFDTIFKVLEEGDDVYVDVTHSFRSIPIIIMSVLNYAKFIKNITIKAIYYGAYEAEEDGISPIFDLSLFNTITDWTIGAEKFINTGDSKQLSKMVKDTIGPILRETKGENEEARLSKKINDDLETFSGALYTVRGRNISEYGCNLKSSLELIKAIEERQLKPFEKIIDRIYEKVHFYSGDIINDIHNTVKLCRDLNLIQQAYTFLMENVINYLCIAADLDISNQNIRKAISDVIPFYNERHSCLLSKEYEDINRQIKPYLNQGIVKLYDKLGGYRNDLNHAGYRQDARRVQKFNNDLDKFIAEFEQLIIEKCYKQ